MSEHNDSTALKHNMTMENTTQHPFPIKIFKKYIFYCQTETSLFVIQVEDFQHVSKINLCKTKL